MIKYFIAVYSKVKPRSDDPQSAMDSHIHIRLVAKQIKVILNKNKQL